MPSEWMSRFALAPDAIHLNHGSFGACPREVLEYQTELRLRLERQPVQFLDRALPGLMEEARSALAAVVRVPADDLALVSNATEGVNTVLRSLEFRPGDEILVTDHGYGACNNAARFVAERSGASVVQAKLPFPLEDPTEVVDAVMSKVSTRLRLALIDHVTSPTGLVLPVEPIVSALEQQGVACLVDGAHAPGMLDLNLEALGCSYYTGNCHKWLCAPKGAAFVFVRRDQQDAIRPLVISHGATWPTDGRTRFRNEFDWTGTRDPTPALCIPKALECMGEMLPGGWTELRSQNHAKVVEARRMLLDALSLSAPCPESMLGSLASIELGDAEPLTLPDPDPLRSWLWAEHRIEVPVFRWPRSTRRVLRISAQVYNDASDYRALADALLSRLSA